jgi:hypothetical protein
MKEIKLKTVTDLRNILADDVMKLRKGDMTAPIANAVTNATGKMLSSCKIELEYNKLMGRPQAIIPFLEQPKEGK